MKAVQRVVPFYFGMQGRELFGCFHEPSQKRIRKGSVLICQPVGHEYINSHRALRQLAARLAEAGFPVLRFDYYGCGDSCGEAGEGSIARWLEDISTAIAALKTRAGSFPVYAVGLRLGATLAAIGGMQRDNLAGLVLWDPVVNGNNYFQELLSLQKEMLRFRPKPKRWFSTIVRQLRTYADRPRALAQRTSAWFCSRNTEAETEVLGFPVSNMLRTELEELDLLKIPGKPAPRVLVVQTTQNADEIGLKDHLIHTEAQVEQQRLDAPQIWLPTADGSLLVPAQALQSLVSWLSGVTS